MSEMNTKAIKFLGDLKKGKFTYKSQNEKLDFIINQLREGEKCKRIINKMKKYQYGAFISLGNGSFVELASFLRDVEEEVK